MMSSSDKTDNKFKPLAIDNLERFDKEEVTRPDESDPDFDRFKLLFDEPRFEDSDPLDFKALYQEDKQKEQPVFKPLIEAEEEPAGAQVPHTEDPDISAGSSDPEDDAAVLPEPSPEEAGFNKGFESGQEQGLAQGMEKGYAEGFEKGEAEGFKEGEAGGFEKGHADGLEKGAQEGEQKAYDEMKASAGQFLDNLAGALQTADQTLELLVDRYEERLISLVRQIAQKTVLAKVEIDDEIVRPMIIDALKTLVEPEEIVLSVSPEDYEYIEMVKDSFFEEMGSLRSVSVKSDPSMSKGGFTIETATGAVSSDIESRLDAIYNALKGAGGHG